MPHYCVGYIGFGWSGANNVLSDLVSAKQLCEMWALDGLAKEFKTGMCMNRHGSNWPDLHTIYMESSAQNKM